MSRILAIDIDQGSAHVASGVARGGSVKLERAVTVSLGEMLTPSNAAALGKQLKDALKSFGIPAGPVVAVVGRDRVILKDIKIPKVAPGEEPALVRFQATNDQTEAADTVILDYFTLDRPDPDGQVRAVTASIRKDLLASYKSLCQAAAPSPPGTTATSTTSPASSSLRTRKASGRSSRCHRNQSPLSEPAIGPCNGSSGRSARPLRPPPLRKRVMGCSTSKELSGSPRRMGGAQRYPSFPPDAAFTLVAAAG